jgi:RNA polymerase sigma-70 factor (ECF subfamily)
LYKNINRVEDEYIKAWLYKTAHNKAINFIKRHSKLVFKEPKELIHLDNTEDEIRQLKIQKAVQNCLKRLKPKHALMIELQHFQKKSYKEISDITGLSIPAVESALVRARKECKNMLKDLLY